MMQRMAGVLFWSALILLATGSYIRGWIVPLILWLFGANDPATTPP